MKNKANQIIETVKKGLKETKPIKLEKDSNAKEVKIKAVKKIKDCRKKGDKYGK